jgi:hypothetical protein
MWRGVVLSTSKKNVSDSYNKDLKESNPEFYMEYYED